MAGISSINPINVCSATRLGTETSANSVPNPIYISNKSKDIMPDYQMTVSGG